MSSTVGLQDVQPCHQTLNSHVSLLGLLMFMSLALDSLFRDRFPSLILNVVLGTYHLDHQVDISCYLLGHSTP